MTDTDTLIQIAGRFATAGTVTAVERLGDGFINDTYLVRTSGHTPDYILQRKNGQVFHDTDGMMRNIAKVTAHIRSKVAAAGGDTTREVMTLVPTSEGALYHRATDGACWAMTLFIPDTVTYPAATSPQLAYMGGKGIGRFQRQLADFGEPLAVTIPGFHDIRHRLNQWDASLARDAAGCAATLSDEIGWIESRRQRMLQFAALAETGVIPLSVTHNDTKISNILFDRDDNVVCVIDLDTVMTAPALNDFGDAIRAYANTGAEDDTDLSRVGLSMEMFEAFARGYLSERLDTLTAAETGNLAFSALYITYEQVLRFLMDHIDGDTYYKTAYRGHNLVRARAQHRLLLSMEHHLPHMQTVIRSLCATPRSRAIHMD